MLFQLDAANGTRISNKYTHNKLVCDHDTHDENQQQNILTLMMLKEHF